MNINDLSLAAKIYECFSDLSYQAQLQVIASLEFRLLEQDEAELQAGQLGERHSRLSKERAREPA